jgi:hypothetical protein
MTHDDFVKEMQENLRHQEIDDLARPKRSPEPSVSETLASTNWDILIGQVRGKSADINKGLPEPLLVYSKSADDEFNLTNSATNLNITVAKEPNGDLVYRGSAGGIFRAKVSGEDVTYSWERTMPTPSMRVPFGSIGVSVTMHEIAELLIRSVVTP